LPAETTDYTGAVPRHEGQVGIAFAEREQNIKGSIGHAPRSRAISWLV